MWSEWLTRTLNPRRRAERERPVPGRRQVAVPPELAADGMHPGADEYRFAMAEVDEEGRE
jgi:hypothetical protein